MNRDNAHNDEKQPNSQPKVAEKPIEQPTSFCCPISKAIMRHPYIASDGHTYEREAIRKCIRSPLTRENLTASLQPNRLIYSMIQDFLKTSPTSHKDVYELEDQSFKFGEPSTLSSVPATSPAFSLPPSTQVAPISTLTAYNLAAQNVQLPQQTIQSMLLELAVNHEAALDIPPTHRNPINLPKYALFTIATIAWLASSLVADPLAAFLKLGGIILLIHQLRDPALSLTLMQDIGLFSQRQQQPPEATLEEKDETDDQDNPLTPQ